jgi:hypothetical protein
MRALVQVFNDRAGLERVVDLITPDVVFQDYPAMPDAGWHRGPQGVIEWGAKWLQLFPDGTLEVFDFRAAGARFFYGYHGIGHGKLSGAGSEFRGWGVGTMSGGRLARLELFTDISEALAAAGLSA